MFNGRIEFHAYLHCENCPFSQVGFEFLMVVVMIAHCLRGQLLGCFEPKGVLRGGSNRGEVIVPEETGIVKTR